MNRKLNKHLLLLTRVVMFSLGAFLGFLGMWQFFVFKPDIVGSELKVVFYFASSIFVALLLFFSAKPVLYLIYGIGEALKKAFGRTKPLDVAGVLLGVIIGLMFGYLTGALLNLFVSILAVTAVISVVVGLITMYIAIMLCTRWLYGKPEEEDIAVFSGYILTVSALKNLKIVKLCTNWLSGNIVVLGCTLNTLMDKLGEDTMALALQNYHTLDTAGLIKYTPQSGGEDSEIIIKAAETRGLKIICGSESEFDSFETVAPILGLDTL